MAASLHTTEPGQLAGPRCSPVSMRVHTATLLQSASSWDSTGAGRGTLNEQGWNGLQARQTYGEPGRLGPRAKNMSLGRKEAV